MQLIRNQQVVGSIPTISSIFAVWRTASEKALIFKAFSALLRHLLSKNLKQTAEILQKRFRRQPMNYRMKAQKKCWLLKMLMIKIFWPHFSMPCTKNCRCQNQKRKGDRPNNSRFFTNESFIALSDTNQTRQNRLDLRLFLMRFCLAAETDNAQNMICFEKSRV